MGFIVINKDDSLDYDVYDISYDKAGYPHFLVFKDNQWMRISAKHFRPIELCYNVGGDIVRG